MFCDQCGTENPNENRYCGQCGAKLDSANGMGPEALHTPAGPVFSAFRREVEQQQLRLQRLEEQPVRSYSDLATSSVENPAEPETPIGGPQNARPEHETGLTEDVETADYQANDETISGPSFLGLSGPGPAPEQDLAYLYEDDAKPGRARKLLALVIAIGFLAFFAYEWRQNPNWQTAIMEKLKRAPTTTATTSAPPPQNAGAEQPSQPASPPPTANVPTAPTDTGQSEAVNPPVESASGSQAGSTSSGTSKEEALTGDAPAHESDVAAGDTNSTAATGEQEAADSGNASNDTGDENRPAIHERAGGNKASVSRKNAAALPAKTEETDNALVQKADAYLYGRGVPKNCQQALVYLRTAANSGNAMARSKLGGLYATGHCVPLDRAEAYNWFTLSRDAGANNVWVQRNREILWSKMTADEKARAMEPPR